MAVDKSKDINVGGTLHSIATGNTIAHADEVMDDEWGKKQSEINKLLRDEYLPLTGGTLTGDLTVGLTIISKSGALSTSVRSTPTWGYTLSIQGLSNKRNSTDISEEDPAVGLFFDSVNIWNNLGTAIPGLNIRTDDKYTTYGLNGVTISDAPENSVLNALGGVTSLSTLASLITPSLLFLPLTGGTVTGNIRYGNTTLYNNGINIYTGREELGSSKLTVHGITIYNKTSNDLLHAAGGTISIDNLSTLIISKITDGAPETLDTLNELAAALGDDPNFAATLTAELGNKVDKTLWDNLPSAIICELNNPIKYTTEKVLLPLAWTVKTSSGAYLNPVKETKEINAATATTAGVMSAADKTKLDKAWLLNSPTILNNTNDLGEYRNSNQGGYYRYGFSSLPADLPVTSGSGYITLYPYNTAVHQILLSGLNSLYSRVLQTNNPGSDTSWIRYLSNNTLPNSILKSINYNSKDPEHLYINTSSLDSTLAFNDTSSTIFPEATTTKNGLLSTLDKAKLNNITTNGDGNSFLSNDGTYKVITGNLSSTYTPSTEVNENLAPVANDSYETAIGKLHKAILDNEEVIAQALVNIQTVLGTLNPNLVLPDLADTNYLDTATTFILCIKSLDSTIKTVSDSISDLEARVTAIEETLTYKVIE